MSDREPKTEKNQCAQCSLRGFAAVLSAQIKCCRSFLSTLFLLTLTLSAQEPPPPEPEQPKLFIAEYRVQGAKLLNAEEVGNAVYPYLGPERTSDDVEQARAALEKAYHDKGWQTVAVEVPPQRPRYGVIVLNVVENKVGRLNINNSKYHRPSVLRQNATSMAEGTIPNFTDVTRDIAALNRIAGSVTPALKQGRDPGTVDIDLNVEDKLPLHGSIELNNRYSADTTPLRLSGSLSYSNLWQLGHTLGASFQVAPENPDDATIYSAYYMLNIPGIDGITWMLQGIKQDSDVSTLGGAAVAGRGNMIGLRAIFNLPSSDGFYHSISAGLDYKSFEEDIIIAGEALSTPIEYYPWIINYGAMWSGDKRDTELNLSANFNMRGMGSDIYEFDNKRFNATGAYIYLRGDLAHTEKLPADFELYAKVQGQIADSPLINSEQFAGGGQSTTRGYLESEALGDNAIFGTLELRSPSLIPRGKDTKEGEEPSSEWRIYAFLDGGRLSLNDPLPDQKDQLDLASYGIGSTVRLANHLHGSIDIGIPLIDQGTTLADDIFVSFRVWADF